MPPREMVGLAVLMAHYALLDANSIVTDWQAPTPKPEGSFVWDEETLAWVEVAAG